MTPEERRPETPAHLAELASAYLESARANLQRASRFFPVAYDEARHAAELFGKCLLLMKTGRYPHKHRIGGILAQEGLVPRTVEWYELNALLDHHTLGRYGLHVPVREIEVREAVAVAEALEEAVVTWPAGPFRPPPPDP